MKKLKLLGRTVCVVALSVICIFFAGCSENVLYQYEPSVYLCDIYEDYFKIGAAVSTTTINHCAELLPHFNSVTCENYMKWRYLESSEHGVYTYDTADEIIDWAHENGKEVRGHCLLWYKSNPTWVPETAVDKESALELIDEHVTEVVTHFGDDVYCWDVVNEALKSTVSSSNLSSGDYYRVNVDSTSGVGVTDWYALCGVDYIKQAFISADNARKSVGADDVKLFYNDYSLNDPNKREACLRLIAMLQDDDIAIDGVGMQGHYRLSNYRKDKETFITNFEDSIKTFTELGLDVQITELDIRIYESDTDPNQYDYLPEDLEEEQAEMYAAIFEICRRYSTPWKEGAGCVTCVTTWGIADDHTSKTNEYHTEYPLIFGANHEYKQAYYAIADFD